MKNFDCFLNKAIKTLLVINICIMLTILSFFFSPSVFALDLPSLNDSVVPSFDTKELSINYNYIVSNGQPFYDNRFYLVGPYSDNVYYDGSVYLFTINNGYVYFASPAQLSLIFYYTFGSNFTSYTTPAQVTDYDSDLGLYITRHTVSAGSPNHLPNYSSLDEAKLALSDYLNNSSSLPDYNGLRIPTGHYARIEFQNNNGSLTLNTTMTIASNTFGTPWPNSSQQWLSTGISSAESINNSSMVDIVWSKAGKTSIFGTTYNASASLSGNNQYLWIYNPIQMNPIFITDGTYYPPNDVITITDLVNVKAVRLYSVTASIFGPASTSDSEYGDSYITSDGAIGWVNQNGDPYTPSNGGGNSQSTDSDSVIQQFRSILSDLVGRIESLLVAPVEYIQRIINAGSTFFAWLSGLWSWLPPAVSGILTSVLYIMAVVGALKLLWR